jgi:hypothetical protein
MFSLKNSYMFRPSRTNPRGVLTYYWAALTKCASIRKYELRDFFSFMVPCIVFQYVNVPNLMSLYIDLFYRLIISTCFGHSLPILRSDFPAYSAVGITNCNTKIISKYVQVVFNKSYRQNSVPYLCIHKLILPTWFIEYYLYILRYNFCIAVCYTNCWICRKFTPEDGQGMPETCRDY